MALAGDTEWNEEEAQKRAIRAITTQAVRAKRREIIRQIRKIQPQAGKNLKDVEVPQSLFQLARDIVRDPEASLRFNKVAVYELLLGDLARRRRESANSGGVTLLDKAVPVLDGWKLASISLVRYALNLVLAPNRAEFKKMKLSTSFYVYNISRHLHHAEEAFKAMGYRATDKKEKKETQDLVYDGDVKLPLVLETATDLLVMHEEVVHLQEAVTTLLNRGRWEVPLENIVQNRRLQFVRAQQGSGIAPSGSPHPNPPPSPHFDLQNPPPPHFNPLPLQGLHTGGPLQSTHHTTQHKNHHYANFPVSQLDTPGFSTPPIPTFSSQQNEALQVQRYQKSKGLPIESAVREAGLLISALVETGTTLGTGSYGKVIEVQVRGRRCAAKKLHGIFTGRDVPPKEKSSITERFETECRRVLYLSHPNIIEMIGIHFDRATRLPTLVMELMDTSLCKYLENNAESSVALSTKYSILHDVASGLVYLHSLPPPLGPIVHRDFTANNILLALTRGMVAKIADLGQAKIDSKYATRQQQLSQVPGNDDHMPPEAWLDNPVYNASLDVFSFGVVMLH
ncbi:Receptor-like serine/threonine-protein kinase SD1-6, partial [Geodia barretti]